VQGGIRLVEQLGGSCDLAGLDLSEMAPPAECAYSAGNVVLRIFTSSTVLWIRGIDGPVVIGDGERAILEIPWP
jgi:hypothetical protein